MRAKCFRANAVLTGERGKKINKRLENYADCFPVMFDVPCDKSELLYILIGTSESIIISTLYRNKQYVTINRKQFYSVLHLNVNLINIISIHLFLYSIFKLLSVCFLISVTIYNDNIILKHDLVKVLFYGLQIIYAMS